MENWTGMGKGARLVKADYVLRIQWKDKNVQIPLVALSPYFSSLLTVLALTILNWTHQCIE